MSTPTHETAAGETADRDRLETAAGDSADPDRRLETAADLRTVYRHASGGAVDKVIDRLDRHCVDFLAASPFFVLSTANADGTTDGSPKGGEPGVVVPLDERRVAFADLSGNNRLDSFENIVTNPSVSLLCMIPGLDETLRVNGTAILSVDPDLRERFGSAGRPARVVVVVEVREAYIHCAKAYRRAGLWNPDSWLEADRLPDGTCMIRDHAAIDAPLDVVRDAYGRDVEATLWQPGGSEG